MKPIVAAAFLLSLSAQGLGQTLLPGSKAPSLSNLQSLSGSIPKPSSGKLTVVEFWATWCGPCIEAMPHLSDLAEKYAGKIDFLSINVRDRQVRNGKLESRKAQVSRIKAWLGKNKDKLRYSVALDTENEGAAKAWLDASKSYTIPAVFIIDTQGKIGWIGHPKDIDKAIVSVMSGKVDYEQNKRQIKARSQEYEELDRARAAFSDAIEKGDTDAFDSILGRKYYLPVSVLDFGLQRAALHNPPFALNRLNHYAKNTSMLEKSDACHIAGMIAQNAKDDKTRKDALAASAKFAIVNTDKFRIYGFWYHARTLHKLGDYKGRDEWLKKVESLKDSISADRYASLQKSINKELGRN